MAVTLYGGYVYNMYDFLFLPLPFLSFCLHSYSILTHLSHWPNPNLCWWRISYMATCVEALGTLVVGDTSVSLWTIKWLWRQEEAAA